MDWSSERLETSEEAVLIVEVRVNEKLFWAGAVVESLRFPNGCVWVQSLSLHTTQKKKKNLADW